MKKVVVTTSWDDGHVLDHTLAALLAKYKVAGTFYISPKDRELDASVRLPPEGVRLLSENFEIGAHTMTHSHLTEIPYGEAQWEIESSKKYLEQCIQKKVTSFCYPGGYYSIRDIELVRSAGFTYARTVERAWTEGGENSLASPTTVQAYRHWLDVLPVLQHARAGAFVKNYLRWDEFAITLFDHVLREGGVFHLWGHSWEIDTHKDWGRLEKVLAYIGNRDEVRYVTNGELV